MKKPLPTNPVTGASEEFIYDETEDKAYIQQTTDVGNVLEHNKREQNDGTGGWSPDKSFRKVGTIPLSIIEKWKEMYGVDVFNKNHAPAVKRLLNSNEWKFLRSAEWKF
jgi:hypothetical protein